jgi:hypothetical protein
VVGTGLNPFVFGGVFETHGGFLSDKLTGDDRAYQPR